MGASTCLVAVHTSNVTKGRGWRPLTIVMSRMPKVTVKASRRLDTVALFMSRARNIHLGTVLVCGSLAR